MPRYHVHCIPLDELWSDADPVITVTLNAADDQFAEINARALLGVCVDIQEIELAEELDHA
jgi:hypothetical protein